MQLTVNNAPLESLQLALAAHKSLVSEYALAARQSREMCALALDPIIRQNVEIIAERMADHQHQILVERSTQLRGLLESTVIALNAQALAASTDAQTQKRLLEIIIPITLALKA